MSSLSAHISGSKLAQTMRRFNIGGFFILKFPSKTVSLPQRCTDPCPPTEITTSLSFQRDEHNPISAQTKPLSVKGGRDSLFLGAVPRQHAGGGGRRTESFRKATEAEGRGEGGAQDSVWHLIRAKRKVRAWDRGVFSGHYFTVLSRVRKNRLKLMGFGFLQELIIGFVTPLYFRTAVKVMSCF